MAVSKVPKQPLLFVYVVEPKVKYSILQKIILLMRQPLSQGIRRWKAEVGRRKTEDGRRESEVGSRKSGQKSEDFGRPK